MPTAALTLHFGLPGCASLKEKRSLIKPVLARLRREFNLSSAETGLQDHWQQTIITCAMAGSSRVVLESSLKEVIEFAARTWPDFPLLDEHIEVF
jgi:uncharacterized protein